MSLAERLSQKGADVAAIATTACPPPLSEPGPGDSIESVVKSTVRTGE